MSDLDLVALAQRAENMAANANTPAAEQILWMRIKDEISAWFAEDDFDEPVERGIHTVETGEHL